MIRGLGVVVCCLLVCGLARGSEEEERQARVLHDEGQRAFSQGLYQHAYDTFKRAYALSHRPAILYNMASAAQRLERPHEAAELLRAYLRVTPEDPNRAELEERVRALEEQQRLLDADRERALAPQRSRKKTLIIALSTAGGVVVLGTVLGLGLGLGLRQTTLDSSLGTRPVTP